MTVQPAAHELRRQLGLWDAVAIFVGIIYGSGIFVAPARVAAAAPGRGSATALWLLAGAVAACGAFCYAECGARLPRTGGFYVFYRETYGEAVAFIGGWAALLITYPASVAAIADIFAQYLNEAVPALPREGRLLGAGAVLLAGGVNALGVRRSAGIQRLLTAVKVGALGLLCLAAVLGPGARLTAAAGARATPWQVAGGFEALLLAAVVVLWTYDGWSDVTLVSGEIREPGRNIGRAVLIGTATLIVLYTIVQLSVLAVLPADRAAASGRVFAEAVEASLGSGAGRLVAILVVVATFGSINAIVLSASRLGFAMARDGVFPAWFGRIHERWGTPARSIAVFVAATLFYTLTSTFGFLLRLFSFSVWIFYGLTAVALVILRRRGVGEPLEWRAPGGALVPVVVLAVAATMTTGLAYQDRLASLSGCGLLAAGAVAYLLWRTLRPHP